MIKDISIVTVMEDIISSMKVQDPSKDKGTFFNIVYEPGTSIQIIAELSKKDNAVTAPNSYKYPLIAMIMPVKTSRGEGNYGISRLPKLIIATRIITTNTMEPVLPKFKSGGNFKEVLYPIYYELLNKIGSSVKTIGQDPNFIKHTLIERPCQQEQIAEGLHDYVDIIEIENLEIKLNQIKNCK